MSSFTMQQYKCPHFSLTKFVNVLSTTAQGGGMCAHWLQMPRAWAMVAPSGGRCCLPALSLGGGESFQKNILPHPWPHLLLSPPRHRNCPWFLRTFQVKVLLVFWSKNYIQIHRDSWLILHLCLGHAPKLFGKPTLYLCIFGSWPSPFIFGSSNPCFCLSVCLLLSTPRYRILPQ